MPRLAGDDHLAMTTSGPVAILQSVGSDGKPLAVPSNINPATFALSIKATDDSGVSSSASFSLVYDEKNDAITAINLYNVNADGTTGDKNVTYLTGVDENDTSRVVLGKITVDDIDERRPCARPAQGGGHRRAEGQFHGGEGRQHRRVLAGEEGRQKPGSRGARRRRQC